MKLKRPAERLRHRAGLRHGAQRVVLGLRPVAFLAGDHGFGGADGAAVDGAGFGAGFPAVPGGEGLGPDDVGADAERGADGGPGFDHQVLAAADLDDVLRDGAFEDFGDVVGAGEDFGGVVGLEQGLALRRLRRARR